VIEPLWQRALAARDLERTSERQARRVKQPGRPDHNRKHPRAKVGDTFGCWTVSALMHPDGTSNERVLARCACGTERPTYVFNLRRRKGDCIHVRRY
jgi:hypothetical protein